MKKIILTKYLLMVLVLCTTSVSALPPKAPHLQEIQFEGLLGTAKWDSNFSQVDGYRLIYANYPSLTNINVIELGTATNYQQLLQNGDALYVAVQAYNVDGNSEISNIEHFKLDRKIVVLLPITNAGGTSGLDLSIKTGIEEALADGLWTDNANRVRWEIIDVVSGIENFGSQTEQLKTLYYGDELLSKISTKDIRGYVNDPNVLAVVTSSTAASLALTSEQIDNEPLIIAGTATSSVLELNKNLMMMPASNKLQADKIHQKLSNDSRTKKRLLKYMIVVDIDLKTIVYSFDLYLSLLQKAFHEEISIQQQASITSDTSKPFAQLVGTLLFDGTEKQAELISNTIDVLEPDVVFHIGLAKLFKMLYDKRPDIAWFGPENVYNYKDYQDGDVTILVLEGEEDINEVSYKNHGYDIVGFLAKVLGKLSDLELNRKRILDMASEITYEGRTGTKGFLEDRGQYIILKTTATGWKKVNYEENE